MHNVKELWSHVIFREVIEPDTVMENRLSSTEVKDGYLNLSNLTIPARCYIQDDLVRVLLINIHGDHEEPVRFRCHQRRAPGKKGKIYKRQRFWPVGFSLQSWLHKQHLEAGDLILMAVPKAGNYLMFRAIRPKTLMMLHDRRANERRALERRFEDRRQTLFCVTPERRKKDRRRNDRRDNDRRTPRSR